MQTLMSDEVRETAEEVIRPEHPIVLIVDDEATFEGPLELDIPVERNAND